MKINRMHELVKILIKQEDYITIQSLSNQLDVSQRTIHNDLSSSDFHSLTSPATLIKKPNKGIRLELTPQIKSQIYHRLKTAVNVRDDRENDFGKILLRLLCEEEEITVEDFCNELYISPSTLYPLFEKIQDYIMKFHCHLHHKKGKGYKLEGNENDIRRLFYDFVTTLLKSDIVDTQYQRVSEKTTAILKVLLYDHEISYLIQILQISENMINTNYVDEDYNRLLIQLSILIIRNKIKKTMEGKMMHDLSNTQEYYYSTLIKTYIEKQFDLLLNAQEINYIALMLLGTRKQMNVFHTQQNIEVLEKFINLLSIRLNVELSNDYELKQNLMNHLKPAIHRMKHGIINENPLLEQIRINYTEIYMAVITTIEDLEYMEQIFFDSNEIGYICLHIIAAMNRPANKKKIRAALLCNEGLSVEIFLKNIIESYFTEIMICDIIRENSLSSLQIDHYDVVLNSTTHYINHPNVLHISTSFTQEDHTQIRHFIIQIATGIIKIDDLYSNYLLFFKDTAKDQKELLQKYCQFLFQNQYVKKDFYPSVLKRIQISSTYVARGIALPHGAKDQVKASVILMIRLEEKILWDNEETDFVILVAANDKDAKDYSYLFRKIMKIAANDELSQLLKNCSDINDLTKLLDTV